MDILLAEDSTTSRKLLTMLLEKWGFNVVACDNGLLAWQAYEAADFRIVISDWCMPEMDGIELCRTIRKCPKRGYTYIILLTGRNAKQDLIDGLDAGADDYLIKPANPDELRARLKVAERVLAIQTEVRQLREIVPICAWCKSIRNDDELWASVESYMASHQGVALTHSMCPECLRNIGGGDVKVSAGGSAEVFHRPRML